MATAHEESKPYESGLGTGGKFRKRPFRRTTQTTPYDRPPTAIRNPCGGGDRNGWLSKLLDPAQKLITFSAHRLFASVFRKRLPPPPPPPPLHPLLVPESEANNEARENPLEARANPLEAISTDLPDVQGDIIGFRNLTNNTNEGGVSELEQILKQKTFTRSEIDHLTTLLRSRTVDIPGTNEEKRSEFNPVVSHGKKEEFPNTLVRENGTDNRLVSTPVVSSTVLDEDIASPAQLAKAYMGSRPSQLSVFGSYNQVSRGDSSLPINKILSPKSPTMSVVPKSSGYLGTPGNGFVTPRSRGRSAIYSMARTPYSRVNSAAAIKGAAGASDAFVGPSPSSQIAWEQSRISGSRQGGLKRRSSVLDNDIGSIGPIRRIRQKSNLLSSKSLSLPASDGLKSAHEAGTSPTGLDTQHHVSLTEAPTVLGEVRHSFEKPLVENGDKNIPGTSFAPVRSKSSETASKILQQLDKLVSPREKSPTKLSPSMLHGQALKSLEKVDSSKFLENIHDSGKLDGSHSALPDARVTLSHKQDKVEENGSFTFISLPDKSAAAVNFVDTNSLMKDYALRVKAADSTVIKSAVQIPQQKRRAFQMSAHEDLLDVDDDDYTNGTSSTTIGKGREKLHSCAMESKSAAAEAILTEKASSLSEVKPISGSVFNQKPDLGISNGLTVKNVGNAFPVAQVAALPVQETASPANKDAAVKHSASTVNNNVTAPMVGFAGKVAQAELPDAAVPTFGFPYKNVSEVSSLSEPSGVKLATSSDQKLENSSSFASIAPGSTNSISDKMDKDNTSVSSAVSTSTASGSIFKFGASANASELNNGSLLSSPFSSSPMPSLVQDNGKKSPSSSTNFMSFTTNIDTSTAATSATASATISNAINLSMQTSVPSFTAPTVFKFASANDTSASIPAFSAPSTEATKAKSQDTNIGNAAVVPFGSTYAFSSSGSSIFGGKSEVSGTVSSTSGGTTAAVTSSPNSSIYASFSSNPNSGSGLFSSTFSTVTSTSNNIFGGTSTAGLSSNVFGGTYLSMASTGSSIFSPTTAISSIGSSIFGFSDPAASTATSQIPNSNPSNAVHTQASATGTDNATSIQSMPIQSASSTSSPSFGLAGNSTFSAASSVFGSSASATKPFGSGATFGMSSASGSNPFSSSSGNAPAAFVSNWQSSSTPIFGSTCNSSSSYGFSFGSSASLTAPSSTTSIFGSSSAGAPSSSMFSFTSAAAAAATSSQPVFGYGSPSLVFSSAPSSNNNQMEDSMAEDTVQATAPSIAAFGQQPITPSTAGFVFGATKDNSYSFGGQPSMVTPQNPSPFQASGSQEFVAGGSFSLGTAGADKSSRKFVKVVRKPRKK